MKHDIRFIAWPDTHIPYQDQRAVDCALSILQWYKPHVVVILGDFLDCAPVSHWLSDNRRELEGMRLVKDFEDGNDLLDSIQESTSNLIYLEGNHEDWIRQALDRDPQLEGLIDLDRNLRFSERPVRRHLRYNECTNLGKLWFTHGTYTGQAHAKKHVESFNRSICYGHIHDVQSYTHVSPVDVEDKHMGQSLGCLSDKNPQFMKNRPNKWVHCVGVGTVRKDGNFNLDPVIISKGVASYAGVTFRG